jgi:hypothetical protein
MDTLLAFMNHFPLFALMQKAKDPWRIPGDVEFNPANYVHSIVDALLRGLVFRDIDSQPCWQPCSYRQGSSATNDGNMTLHLNLPSRINQSRYLPFSRNTVCRPSNC